ncbi:MAG: hypothetical protein R2726_08170 [Acidimicrobiales bacterium]
MTDEPSACCTVTVATVEGADGSAVVVVVDEHVGDPEPDDPLLDDPLDDDPLDDPLLDEPELLPPLLDEPLDDRLRPLDEPPPPELDRPPPLPPPARSGTTSIPTAGTTPTVTSAVDPFAPMAGSVLPPGLVTSARGDTSPRTCRPSLSTRYSDPGDGAPVPAPSGRTPEAASATDATSPNRRSTDVLTR